MDKLSLIIYTDNTHDKHERKFQEKNNNFLNTT